MEPFVGGGSVFFHLTPDNAFLSDVNPLLTNTYNVIKEDVEAVINILETYRNEADFYYRIRQERPLNDIHEAARFIYLNQTSFNGIYRENLKGEYNVPFGYRSKEFLNPQQLRDASAALQSATIVQRDFTESLENINQNDLVFIDPPYTVTHNNNGFIKYNANLFDLSAQHRLAEFMDEIRNRGALYILTNAAHADIRLIFERDRDRLERISRASLIGGRNAKRGNYDEFIFTNIHQQ